MQKINKHTLIEICMIALGCAIYGISLDMISVPNKLADGGISGISLFCATSGVLIWGYLP